MAGANTGSLYGHLTEHTAAVAGDNTGSLYGHLTEHTAAVAGANTGSLYGHLTEHTAAVAGANTGSGCNEKATSNLILSCHTFINNTNLLIYKVHYIAFLVISFITLSGMMKVVFILFAFIKQESKR